MFLRRQNVIIVQTMFLATQNYHMLCIVLVHMTETPCSELLWREREAIVCSLETASVEYEACGLDEDHTKASGTNEDGAYAYNQFCTVRENMRRSCPPCACCTASNSKALLLWRGGHGWLPKLLQFAFSTSASF